MTAVVLASASALAFVAQALPLRTVARVPLPGPSVRFDYTSIDPTTNRLYIAHMDASQLLILNLHTRRVIKTISAAGVHGVLAVPSLNRVYASATNDREAIMLNGRTRNDPCPRPCGRVPRRTCL